MFKQNKILTLVLSIVAILSLVFASIYFVSAEDTGHFDLNQKVSFSVNCDKEGYIFNVYKIADLEYCKNAYGVRYNSLLSDVENNIFNGNVTNGVANGTLLAALDKVSNNKLSELYVDKYIVDEDGIQKTFLNLDQGVYYLKAVSYPAGVYKTQNSIISLPYYFNGIWNYEINEIKLASKVDDLKPRINQKIINSTIELSNGNFTDTAKDKLLNVQIHSNTAGYKCDDEYKNHLLSEYTVIDKLCKGYTLDKSTINVYLDSKDFSLVKDEDYIINVLETDDYTIITVKLTDKVLKEDQFYNSYDVVINYDCYLNERSTTDLYGNSIDNLSLTYTNDIGIQGSAKGNDLYSYTFNIEVNKYNDVGQRLKNAEFKVYDSLESAKKQENEIATAISDDNGKGYFKAFNVAGELSKTSFQSGVYYLVETIAPDGYNRYTDVIQATINVQYSSVFNEEKGTYIVTGPEKGVVQISIKNSAVVFPQTGLLGTNFSYLIALLLLLIAVSVFFFKVYLTSYNKENNK